METAVAVAEVVDVEAKAAVVVVAWAQEEIVSALVAVQEQTRKRLLIELSSLDIYQALYFLKTCLPTIYIPYFLI